MANRVTKRGGNRLQRKKRVKRAYKMEMGKKRSHRELKTGQAGEGFRKKTIKPIGGPGDNIPIESQVRGPKRDRRFLKKKSLLPGFQACFFIRGGGSLLKREKKNLVTFWNVGCGRGEVRKRKLGGLGVGKKKKWQTKRGI